MSEIQDRFSRDYAPAFLQYLAQRTEPALATAYELGRNALRAELSMLDLVQIHHALLLKVLRTSRSDEDLEDIAGAASAFLVEVLATFEMAQRGFLEARQAAAVDQGPGTQQPVLGHGVAEPATGLDSDEVAIGPVQDRRTAATRRRRGTKPPPK